MAAPTAYAVAIALLVILIQTNASRAGEAWLTSSPRGGPRWDFECLPLPPSRIFEVSSKTRAGAVALLRDRKFVILDQDALRKLVPNTKLDPLAMAEQAARDYERNADDTLKSAHELPANWFERDKAVERLDQSAAYHRFLAAYNRAAAFKLTPYLVRAVILDTGARPGFSVTECGRTVIVNHATILPRERASERRPLIVFLANEPSDLIVHAQGLE